MINTYAPDIPLRRYAHHAATLLDTAEHMGLPAPEWVSLTGYSISVDLQTADDVRAWAEHVAIEGSAIREVPIVDGDLLTDLHTMWHEAPLYLMAITKTAVAL